MDTTTRRRDAERDAGTPAGAPVAARVAKLFALAGELAGTRAAGRVQVDPDRPLGAMAAVVATHRMNDPLRTAAVDADVALALAADATLDSHVRDAGARWAAGLAAAAAAETLPAGAMIPDGFTARLVDVLTTSGLDPETLALVLSHLASTGALAADEAAQVVAAQRHSRRRHVAGKVLAGVQARGPQLPEGFVAALLPLAELPVVRRLVGGRGSVELPPAVAVAALARICREKPSDAASAGEPWLSRYGGHVPSDQLPAAVRADLARLGRKAAAAGAAPVAVACRWLLDPATPVAAETAHAPLAYVQARACAWLDLPAADGLLRAYRDTARADVGAEVLSGQALTRLAPTAARSPASGLPRRPSPAASVRVRPSDASMAALSATIVSAGLGADELDGVTARDVRLEEAARVAALRVALVRRRVRRRVRSADDLLVATATPLSPAGWRQLLAAASADGSTAALVDLLAAADAFTVDVRDVPVSALTARNVSPRLRGAALGWVGELTLPQARTALGLLADFDGTFGRLLEVTAALTG